MNGSWQPNGVSGHDNGLSQAPQTKHRMPTVHEALPYTPMSSIIPFSPAVIPPPLALPTNPPALFATHKETQNAKLLLEQLSDGATNAETASKRCRQTLSDVQRLLDPAALTQYQFKSRRVLAGQSEPQTNDRTRPALKVATAQLTPLAHMVFDQNKIPFWCPTPDSASPKVKRATKGGPVSGKELPTPTHAQTNGIPATPSSQQRGMQAVVVSNSLTPAQQAQYQYIAASGASVGAQNSFSKRAMIVSQQEKGDQAVQNLQALLSEIFQAEDYLEPDTSGAVSSHAAEYFTLDDGIEDSRPVLQAHIQSKLESYIHKAASCGRLADVDVDHLTRTQGLCERPASVLESLSFHIAEDWADDEIQDWLSKLKTGEIGLAASRTLTWIMTGAAQKKELQSEDYLRIILEGLKAVVEGCLIPIVQEPALLRERVRGEKEAPPFNPKFVIASDHRKEVLALLHAATKSVRLLGDLLVKIELDETSISSVEYLCKTLIFAENASTDRDSAIGIQNFETLRRCAMDVLAKIFTKYTGQRQYIFDEVLISLEKLPATKQSARQYKLPDAKPIQLVSALLMRLVQTSATRSSEALKLRSKLHDDNEDEDEDEEDDDSEAGSGDESDEDEIKVSPAKKAGSGGDLHSLTKPLHDAAQTNANYIVHILIQRALSTSKSSEEPYRKLLDIFTEDFLSCLGCPDWPAAELILRALTMRMIGIVEKDSSTVPSRVLALELLGNLGSGILELQMSARKAAQAIDTNDNVARSLCDMVSHLETGALDPRDVFSLRGPYRVVIEYINARNVDDDAQLTTAKGYYLMQWANATFNRRQGSADSDGSDTPLFSKDLQMKLKQMLVDPHWFDVNGELDNPTTSVGKLAAMALTLNSTFCRAFNKIFGMFLTAMSGEHSTSLVKSRGVKSVVTLLEKDASLLERNAYVMTHILRCASDASPLVRDSALGLIDKCVSLRPALSANIYKTVILRTNDGATTVRKRALKMLKDIYLRNNDNAIRSAIANAIIARIEDTEESVVEIARTMMEEIWFHPLYSLKVDGDQAVKAKLAYGAHAALFVETVERNDEVLNVLEALLKRILAKSKTVEANARVCKTLIAVLFDGIIDNSEIPGSPPQDGILRSLTIFARSSPILFTPTQLERLEPYTQNLNANDDLDVYRSVVTILRYVLPHQSVVNQDFLKKMQTTLLTSVTRLLKAELSETVPCLWTISVMISDTQRIATFVTSLLVQVVAMRNMDFATEESKGLKLIKLVRIAGEFGNACDLSSFLSDFKKKFPALSGESVPDLLVEALCPFTSPTRPMTIREVALEAVCSVSQAWPKLFTRKDVENAFGTVLQERKPSLEVILLSGLEAFFIAQETPEEGEEGLALGSGIASGTERLSKTYVATDQDGASIAMAQRFISQIINIAVSSCDEVSFVAAQLVVSINKQGMVHPKESVPALVALETCPNKAVASAAFKEHKSQHSKHESLYDKEYMRAIQRTFEYQRNVIGNMDGWVGQPPTAKMHLTWEVLKTAKGQVRKKYLSNMVLKLDFDPTGELSQHLLFVRFCVENLAFMEYDRIDDLVQLLTTMEKVFNGTGSTVAQVIESEVFKIQVDGLMDSAMPNGTSATMRSDFSSSHVPAGVDPQRLHHLAVASQILTLIWETRSLLLRLWNMQRHMTKAKQVKDKEAAKAPNRSTNATSFSDTYLKHVGEISAPLNDETACRRMCSAFVQLITVDENVKVGSDEDADDLELMNGYDTPSGSSKKSPSLPPSGTGKGRKRKLSSAANTPRKKGRPGLGGKKRSSAKFSDDEDDEDGWD